MSPRLRTQKRTLRFRPTLGVRRMSGVAAPMPDCGPAEIQPSRPIIARGSISVSDGLAEATAGDASTPQGSERRGEPDARAPKPV